MYRARTFTLIALCAFASLALTGCTTGGGADAQYANDGVLASGAAQGSLADQVGGSDSIFGNYDLGSGVAGDTSITGSIPASYGAVPGGLSLNQDASQLTPDDSVTDSTPFDSIALSDPTASTSLFDAAGDDSSSTIDGLVTATDTNFDSAMSNAQDAYAAVDDGSIGLDPSLASADPTVGMDDPSAGLGPDSLPDF